MSCELAPKDPHGVAPYQLDLSRYFQAHSKLVGSTDALSFVEVVPVDADDQPDTNTTVVIESVQFTSTGLVTVWVSGGTVGETVRLRVRFEGTLDTPVKLTDDRTLMFRIMNQ